MARPSGSNIRARDIGIKGRHKRGRAATIREDSTAPAAEARASERSFTRWSMVAASAAMEAARSPPQSPFMAKSRAEELGISAELQAQRGHRHFGACAQPEAPS
jgi:hypothetical protein